jgi:hypothetical protein
VPTFEVGLSLGELQKDLLGLGQSAPLILSRAINRAATSGKTAMARAIAADTGIRNKVVADEIKILKATRKEPKAVIEIRGRRIPLIEFKARGPEPSRGKGRGVSYTLPTGRGRVANAFIATMPQGHRGVFKRLQTPRLPIKELFGPSLPHVFEKFLPTFSAAAQESLVKNIVSEIRFERSKQAGAE